MKPVFSQTQPVLHQIKLCDPVRNVMFQCFDLILQHTTNSIDVSKNGAPVVFWHRHKFSYTETCDDTKSRTTKRPEFLS